MLALFLMLLYAQNAQERLLALAVYFENVFRVYFQFKTGLVHHAINIRL